MSKLDEVLREVTTTHAGEIGTHYEGCWKYHAGCLAVFVEDLLDDHNTYHYERGYDKGYDECYDSCVVHG